MDIERASERLRAARRRLSTPAAGEAEAEPAVTREELRRIGEEWSAAEEELHRLVAALTAERDDALKASGAKDAFLATLSHELRTPMTAIVGWAHVLRQGADDEEVRRRAVETIDRAARAQMKLVTEILDMSRIVSDRLGLEPCILDLAPVVEAAVEMLRTSAEAKKVRFATRIAAGLVVCADLERIQQVLWNVVANAVKFTRAGGRVEVSLSRGGDGKAVITVSDDGDGIAPEVLPFVFERFRQGGASASAAGGLGLGLAIARHIVERHDGTIRAASEGVGQGAVFVITLPIHEPGRPWPSGLERRRHDRSARVPTGVIRLLLVEDDEDTREAMAAALRNAGFEVETAATAEEAVQRFSGRRPDVVVSDLAMPGEDGCALVKNLRDLDGDAYFGALALTAYASGRQESRARAAGFDAYVAKPITMSDLAATATALAARSERPS